MESVLEPVSAVTIRSLAISGAATLLASAWSVPIAVLAGRPGSRVGGTLVMLMESLVGVPTVLIGLLLYLLLSRSGPLGFLGLLYTPAAISIGEAILITPLIIAGASRAVGAAGRGVWLLAETLGAPPTRSVALVIRETLPLIAGAIAMGFSRAIGEIGIALIVGGSIKGYTRTLTTSIALATSMGQYGTAIKLGAILALLSIGVGAGARLVLEKWRSA